MLAYQQKRKSTLLKCPNALTLEPFKTFIRITGVVRTGAQVDATVRIHGNHGSEAAVIGHHVAVTVAVQATAVIVVLDHNDRSGVSCLKTQADKEFSSYIKSRSSF